jgi:hypothetical protein
VKATCEPWAWWLTLLLVAAARRLLLPVAQLLCFVLQASAADACFLPLALVATCLLADSSCCSQAKLAATAAGKPTTACKPCLTLSIAANACSSAATTHDQEDSRMVYAQATNSAAVTRQGTLQWHSLSWTRSGRFWVCSSANYCHVSKAQQLRTALVMLTKMTSLTSRLSNHGARSMSPGS